MNDETRSYNQLQQDNEQQEKEVERLTLEVETLKAFERNRSQAYHSKPVLDAPGVGVAFAEFMFWYGVKFKSESEYTDRDGDSIILEAFAAWKARQEGGDDE